MSASRNLSWYLWPLTISYAAATYARSAAYDLGLLRPRRLEGVVISVGNLTTGGTGKTPMVELIVDRLGDEGKQVGILTRGYRGQRLADGTATSDEVEIFKGNLSDEVKIGVGPDRFAVGQQLARAGVQWFVLDDGFQHRQLARDADVVLIDATNPFGGGHLLPVGRLREPKSALGRADIVVITRSESEPALEESIRRITQAPIFYAHTELDYLLCLNRSSGGLPGARLHKWFAFCGIGNPEAFIADLKRWNFDLKGWKFFPDHHRYTPDDARAIEEECGRFGADTLVCTEKDAVNLGGAKIDAYELSYVRISMKLARPEDFWTELMNAVNRRRAVR